MTSQTGQQIIAIHILSNISRSKGNQAIKFGQLIEYNMRNILFKKTPKKCDGEASPRPFHEKSKLSIHLDQQSENLYSLFLVHVQVLCLQKYIKTKVATTCFYLI